MNNIQMTEYFSYRPFIIGWPEIQLLFRQARKD